MIEIEPSLAIIDRQGTVAEKSFRVGIISYYLR